MVTEKGFFSLLFFNHLYLYTGNVLEHIRFLIHICNINVEGIVSQILVLHLSFYFMRKKKTGKFL